MNIYNFKVVMLLAFAIVLIIFMSRKYDLKKYNKYFFCTLSFGVALLSIVIGCTVNPVKDKITFTALCQEGEGSNKTDIIIECVRNDGVEARITDIVEGKWYFADEDFLWQSESRNPSLKNITEQVTVRVPIGLNRKIEFCEKSGGYVRVNTAKEEYVVDTNNTKILEVHPSNVLLYCIQQLAQIAVIFLIIFLTMKSAIVFLEKYPNVDMKKYHMVASIVFVYIIGFMWLCRNEYTLIFDGLCQLSYIDCPISDTFKIVSNNMTDPLIYTLLSWIWYRLIPFGIPYLMILPEMLALLGMFSFGYIVAKRCNARIGIYMLVLIALFPQFYSQLAFDNRQYALWFFLSVLLFDVYYKRFEREKKRDTILYIFIMALAVLTQYLILIVCGIMFLRDVYLVVKRKNKVRILTPYLIAGIMFVPFGFSFIKKHAFSGNGSFSIPAVGGPEDTWTAISEVVSYYTNDNFIWLLLFALGLLGLILCYKKKYQNDFLMVLSQFAIGYSVLYTYYGIVLAKHLGWPRYYMCVFPVFILLCAVGFDILVKGIQKYHNNVAQILFVLLMIMIIQNGKLTIERIRLGDGNTYHFQEAADWLSSQYKDIYNEDTLVIFDHNPILTGGWYEYFLTRKGLRDNINVISSDNVDWDNILQYKKIYVCGVFETKYYDSLTDEYDMGTGREKYYISEYRRRDG